MATVTAFTAERSQEIEDQAIVSGRVAGDDLILTKHNGTEINAGNVRGGQGPTGTTGGIADAPSNDSYYVRRNGAWVLERISNAPSDGLKYSLRNGAWVRTERAWKCEFSSAGPTPPSGWATPKLKAGKAWTAKFSGSDHFVCYALNFFIAGSVSDGAARITLPTSMRPVIQARDMAFMSDGRAGYVATGVAQAIIETNGDLSLPRVTSAPLMQADVSGSAVEHVYIYPTTVDVEIYISGTFTRSSSDLPNTAVYV